MHAVSDDSPGARISHEYGLEGQLKAPLMGKVSTPFEGRRPKEIYKGDGTFFSSVITLANSAIGAGVLTFPYAFMNAGLAAAALICVALACVMGFSLHVIASCTAAAQREDPRVRSYQDVMKRATGGAGKMQMLVEVSLILYLFGGCIAFLIIIGDMLEPLVALDRRIIISAITVCVVAPLCQLTRLSALRFSSTLAVLAVTYMVCMIVAEEPGKAAADPPPSTQLLKSGTGAFIAMPLMCLAFQCHIPCALIYTELQAELRSVKTMDRVIGAAYAICLALYIPAGIFGYLSFGENTASDVLKVPAGASAVYAYPVSDVFAYVARICITVTVTFAFPIVHFPAKSALFDFLLRCGLVEEPIAHSKKQRIPRNFLRAESLIWVVLTLGVALSPVSLGVVNDLVAATCGVLVIFIFPGRMWSKFGPEGTTTNVQVALMYALGIVIGVAGTATTIASVLDGDSK